MSLACIILAAGQGTRMRSATPKVLHRVCGLPMLQCVIDAAKRLRPEKIVVVVGRDSDLLRRGITDPAVRFAVQPEPKGTADAVRSALPLLKGFNGEILVLNGDTPLVSAGTLRKFLGMHRTRRTEVSVLSFDASDPRGYGRIIRDARGGFVAIVEEKDADMEQRAITEVNSGVYALGRSAAALLKGVRMNTRKKEYYLTDIIDVASRRGRPVAAFRIGGEDEFMGVNTREELLRASELMRQFLVRQLIARDVNIVDPGSVFLHPHAVVGRESVIYPNVCIEGRSVIGRNVTVYPHVRISESRIGDNAVIRDATVIEQSRVGADASVGPFAHVRPGSDIGAGARVGNFVELKKTRLAQGAKASHLSYLGDADIGKRANIGAGTITCNYDGTRKHRTVIDDDVFVGSDTQLIAPVRVGRGSYVGAGSTITKDVPAGALAVSRTEQRTINGWALKRKSRLRK